MALKAISIFALCAVPSDHVNAQSDVTNHGYGKAMAKAFVQAGAMPRPSTPVVANLAPAVAPASVLKTLADLEEQNQDLKVAYQRLRTRVQKMAFKEETWTCTIKNSKQDRTLKTVKHLNSGAGGAAFLAQDQSTGGFAVIKTLRYFGVKDVENLLAIGRLAESQGREPQHLNMLELGFEDQRLCCNEPCVVIRHVNGKTLHEIVEAGGSMPYENLRSIIWQTLLGWVEMEKAGFCNKDQHLGNVMLEENPLRVVLIDFGLAVKSPTCNPALNFRKPKYEMMLSVDQPFHILGHLLVNEIHRREYMTMCAQVGSMPLMTSAKESLSRVVFGTASIPQTLQPVGFFALRSVEAFQSEIRQSLGMGEEDDAMTAEAPLPNAHGKADGVNDTTDAAIPDDGDLGADAAAAAAAAVGLPPLEEAE